ncbi:MAG: hypothetical protein NVS9B3_09170 [Gemmatimonadaceae bacterium]
MARRHSDPRPTPMPPSSSSPRSPDRCEICGADRIHDAPCPYASPRESAPSAGDFTSMALGTLSHQEHELRLARWNAHHDGDLTPAAREWTRGILAQTTGKPTTPGRKGRG